MAATITNTRTKSIIDSKMGSAVEARLNLPNGTTFKEIASDLVNRFGDRTAGIKADKTLGGATTYAVRNPGVEKRAEVVRLKKEANALKEVARKDRAKQVAEFGAAVEPCLVETYGGKKVDEHGRAYAYGDRVEILSKGHVKLLY